MGSEKQIFKTREADFPFESRSELRSLILIIRLSVRSPRPSIIGGGGGGSNTEMFQIS